MKKSIFAIMATVTVGSVGAAGPTSTFTITPITAVQYNNAANLNSAGQRSLAGSIATITNNLNTSAANLGVSNQVQWNGTAIGGASNNISTDLGQLFQNIDNPFQSSSPNNTLSFNAGSWTLSGTAPVATSSTGCDMTCLITQANTTARNIGLQTTSTINSMANVIGGQVVSYNTTYSGAYASSNAVTSANLSQAQADYTAINNNVTSTQANVLAAKDFNFASAFNTAAGSTFLTGTGGAAAMPSGTASTNNGINGNTPSTVAFSVGTITAANGQGNNVTPTGLNNLKTNGAGAAPTQTTIAGNSYWQIGGKYYSSYTNYVAGLPAGTQANISQAIASGSTTTSTSIFISPGTTLGNTVNVNGVNGYSTTLLYNPTVNGTTNPYSFVLRGINGQYYIENVIAWSGVAGSSNPTDWTIFTGTGYATAQAAITAAGL